MIALRYCTLEFPDWGAVTCFPDGTYVNATPHDTHHYHVVAHRLGYGDDILAYCQQHEFAHSFVAQELKNGPSVVLWELAHGRQADRGAVIYEEATAQTFQRWLQAGEMPIISGADWERMRVDARRLLAA